ncbi:hypothetical protein [Methylogaea oryzae]|uniref:hypothetical protein n=1 Tax=Methylogaea oryzae TaxID=1295382 RepID=UPI0006D21B89|nr:hypothetical protein [Methylogaea oryzae]
MHKLAGGALRLLVAGLMLAGAVCAADIQFRVERFEVAGENPLSAAETQAVLTAFSQRSQDLNGLNEAAKRWSRLSVKRAWRFTGSSCPPRNWAMAAWCS